MPLWQPAASMLTNAPETSSNRSNSGIAVISLDFSSVRTWAGVAPFSDAHALTIWTVR